MEQGLALGALALRPLPRERFDGQDVGELYDLDADPDETRNLYREPPAPAIVNEGHRLLLEWLIRTTRISTVHPTTLASGSWLEVGKCTHPVCSDGRAPNAVLPRFSAKRNVHYL